MAKNKVYDVGEIQQLLSRNIPQVGEYPVKLVSIGSGHSKNKGTYFTSFFWEVLEGVYAGQVQDYQLYDIKDERKQIARYVHIVRSHGLEIPFEGDTNGWSLAYVKQWVLDNAHTLIGRKALLLVVANSVKQVRYDAETGQTVEEWQVDKDNPTKVGYMPVDPLPSQTFNAFDLGELMEFDGEI